MTENQLFVKSCIFRICCSPNLKTNPFPHPFQGSLHARKIYHSVERAEFNPIWVKQNENASVIEYATSMLGSS